MAEDKADIPLELKLDGDKVNEYVASAVLQSKLGERIKSVTEELLRDKGGFNRDDAMTTVIKDVIREQVRSMLLKDEDLTALIRSRIEKALVEKLTDEAIGNLVDKAISGRY